MSLFATKILRLELDQKIRRIPAGLKKELSYAQFNLYIGLFNADCQTGWFSARSIPKEAELYGIR